MYRSIRLASRRARVPKVSFSQPSVRAISSNAFDTDEIEKSYNPPGFNRHRSNAEELIAKVPVIEVEGSNALCDGGGGATGHPLHAVQLNTRYPQDIGTCLYCGLRYRMKEGYHGDH